MSSEYLQFEIVEDARLAKAGHLELRFTTNANCPIAFVDDVKRQENRITAQLETCIESLQNSSIQTVQKRSD